MSEGRGGGDFPQASPQLFPQVFHMLWLGLQGRKALAELDERIDRLERSFRDLDGEMTNHVDRWEGIAKRFSGRKGGRPPAAPPSDEFDQAYPDDPASAEIVRMRRRGRGA